MSNGWFETVAAAQRRAKKQLPKSVYWSIVAGSEQGATLKDNVAAFGELGFTPHAGGLPAKRDLATTVLTVREEPWHGARCRAGRGAVEAGPGLGQRWRAEGASRPRARARSTASPRRCVPSFA